jgi:hypothetical protein
VCIVRKAHSRAADTSHAHAEIRMVRKDIQNKGCAEKVLCTHFSKKGGHNQQLLQKYIAKRMGTVNSFFTYLLQKGGRHNKQFLHGAQLTFFKRVDFRTSTAIFPYILQKAGTHIAQLIHIRYAKGWACTADLYTFCKRSGMHIEKLIHISYAKGWANSQTFCKGWGMHR